MASEYHNPVMLHECLEGLAIKASGIYVDVTFGGGGHSKAILKKISGGRLLAFDQDEDALENAPKDPQFTFVHQNFQYMKKWLKFHGVEKVDGILADLGISSHQIDVPERGFSTRFDAPLDMRMDTGSSLSAATVVNTYPENELHKIFGMYGEVKNAKTLARTIVTARLNLEIISTFDLIDVIKNIAPKGKDFKYYAQVFQALRIEVNGELDVLKEFLMQSSEVLAPGGRLVVMSYHSLEDRLVKNFIQKGKFSGELEKDFYGNPIKPLEAITRKAVMASDEEIELNGRARSAKLRVAEKK
ncbi:MAG: 16S rRNA (cytosine1402-N4)-methyltransferase [Sphingobacteriales bacterium]|jgi:16S rRNA (cytosine1402-N4)-methyltransferase